MKYLIEKGKDKMEIEVLADGTFKVSTDKVSMPNHGNAEMLIREMVKLGNGTVERKGKQGKLTHSHDGHTHTH